MVRVIIIGCIIFSSISASAQNINAFAKARCNKTEVLVEQAIKVTVTVYTSTWFTKPLQIENLQVEGAFVQTFSRTLSSIQYIDKQKYASLEFYYIIFPYKDGELTFPELNIITVTPPEGDYKGKSITLKTKPISINVKPIPKNADTEHWLVASNVSISDRWDSDLKTIKVGDVIKRTITSRASGTLPSFIDEPIIEDVKFGNIYPSEPKYFDERDEKSANGKRIDTYSYLLAKEGDFTIPEVEISWYNPYVGKFYKKKLSAINISISENLDMAALVSLKDSLNSLNKAGMEDLYKSKEEINFKHWILSGLLLLLIFLLLTGVYYSILKIKKIIQDKRMDYRNSEAFWFHKLMNQDDEIGLLKYLYKWIDHSILFRKKTTVSISDGDEQFDSMVERVKKNIFSNGKQNPVNIGLLKRKTKKRRTEKIRENKQHIKRKVLIDNINPE